MQNLEKKYPEKIKLFKQSIKSEETRRVYMVHIKRWAGYLGKKNIMLQSDPRKIEDHIINFIISMKEEGKSFSAIHNYVSAIIKFYTINDIVLNSSKIYRFLPEKKKSKKDRGYTHEEIHRLLDIADERMRTVILLLSSTGMRIGAIPDLRLRNLEKVESDLYPGGIYKITGYEGFNEEYITFTTPECSKAIDQYLNMRERYGEKLTKDSFLIREQFDIRDPFAISKCQKTVSNTLSNKITDLAIRSGIRNKEVLEEDKKHLGGRLRKDVPIAHGFRKFFTTQLVEADVKTELRWLLEGHNLKGNDSNYIRVSEKRLQEEYEKAINHLTINEENRLKRKIEVLKIEKSRIDMLEAKIQKLERKHGR